MKLNSQTSLLVHSLESMSRSYVKSKFLKSTTISLVSMASFPKNFLILSLKALSEIHFAELALLSKNY